MDMDCLLATRSEFLLGRWLEDAKSWGKTEAERRQYERNARLQITVWGPSAPDAFLFDYANKQWSGLIRGYYIPRWRHFLDYLASQPSGRGRFADKDLPRQYDRPTDDANEFYKKLSRWEQAWCDQTELYPTQASGRGTQIAAELLAKWNGVRLPAYRRYDLRSLA
jgi:alpha-N-acetylglucosaminidase